VARSVDTSFPARSVTSGASVVRIWTQLSASLPRWRRLCYSPVRHPWLVCGKEDALNRATRYAADSVVFDKRRKTWNWFYYEAGRRRSKLIGTKQQYPTKAAARRAADPFHRPAPAPDAGPTFRKVLRAYMKEQMPKRFSTRRGYRSWLRNHILPRWGGGHLLTEVQPRPVKLWLDSLTDLTPKSRGHIKGLLYKIWDFGMFAGWVPISQNPTKLVHVDGVSKRRKVPRSLIVEEFVCFVDQLVQIPVIRVLAIVLGCLGLRVSEALALRWSDMDFVTGRLKIERGIVRQIVDEVKTEYSGRAMPIDPKLARCASRLEAANAVRCA
jgi:integrase